MTLIRQSMCDLGLSIYRYLSTDLRQRKHKIALTCISGLCTGLAHVCTDFWVLCGNGLPHWHEPLHRQTHRLPHPDQGLCGFLCDSGSLLVVYQRCYLLIQETNVCKWDCHLWNMNMYYMNFMFSYISKFKKTLLFSQIFKKILCTFMCTLLLHVLIVYSVTYLLTKTSITYSP